MEESKPQKKSFWKTLGKVVAVLLPVAIAASKAGQIGGTGGAILKEMDAEKATDKE